MDRPLSQLKAFFRLAAEKKLCGNDQLLYLHLWNAFNAARWAATVKLTDGELLKRMNQHDSSGAPLAERTMRDMKARLKQRGFIDFVSGKGARPTEYRLIQLYEETDVLAVWAECNGAALNAYMAGKLQAEAERLGVENVIKAIRRARASSKYGAVNYAYFMNYLERSENDGRIGGGTEQYAELIDGEVPAEYAVS